MGKYKKSFPKKEAKDNPKENSFKERAEKNAKDLNENSYSSTHSTFQNKQMKNPIINLISNTLKPITNKLTFHQERSQKILRMIQFHMKTTLKMIIII